MFPTKERNANKNKVIKQFPNSTLPLFPLVENEKSKRPKKYYPSISLDKKEERKKAKDFPQLFAILLLSNLGKKYFLTSHAMELKHILNKFQIIFYYQIYFLFYRFYIFNKFNVET